MGAPKSRVLASVPLSKLQRIDPDKVGYAGMETGSLGGGIGLETPG